jgi:hypothetical protein
MLNGNDQVWQTYRWNERGLKRALASCCKRLWELWLKQKRENEVFHIKRVAHAKTV